jgi:MFS family permease
VTSHGDVAALQPSLSRVQLVGIAGGAALVPLNSTMIAVALPRIADDFDISIGRASLLVTVYLVAMLLGQPVAGRLGDAVGHRRLVRIALVGFAAMSIVGALAPSFVALLAARVGQAACGAAIGPGVQAMLRMVTPPAERGRTFGFLGSIIGIGAAAGPVLGGGLTALFGWEAIMLVNLPIVAWALVAAPPATDSSDRRRRPHDVEDGPWMTRVFVACCAIQALTTVGQYMLLLVTPVILEGRGWSSAPIGLVLSTMTVGLIVMGPVGGRAGDQRGRRWPVSVGVTVALAAIVCTAIGGTSIPIAVMVVALAASGLGLGFALPSVMTSAVESVDERRAGAASGLFSTSRYVGSIGTSLLLAAWITDDGGGAGQALWVAAAASAIALGCVAFLPTRPE